MIKQTDSVKIYSTSDFIWDGQNGVQKASTIGFTIDEVPTHFRVRGKYETLTFYRDENSSAGNWQYIAAGRAGSITITILV